MFDKLKKKKKKIIRVAIIVVTIIAAVLFCHFYVGTFVRISTDSMNPALSREDVVFMKKLASIHRFDMVQYEYGLIDEIEYGRIIGMPEETVVIKDGIIYIDGEELEEYYGNEPIYRAGLAEEEIQLGKDEYFILGDNRNDSMDSRKIEVECVKQEQIHGTMEFRFYPLNAFGGLSNQ